MLCTLAFEGCFVFVVGDNREESVGVMSLCRVPDTESSGFAVNPYNQGVNCNVHVVINEPYIVSRKELKIKAIFSMQCNDSGGNTSDRHDVILA